MHEIQNIVIVGGGTAGWLTAGVIAAKHQARRQHGFTVTLVESPNVPTIGVGEGTWPTLRTTLKRMGVSETELFRQCDASFKQGARFNRWTTGTPDDGYYHPLMLPQQFGQVNLAPHWLADEGGTTFCDTVTPQGRICDEGLGPKTIATPEYDGHANYAYHLDAGKFSHFLQRHCCDTLGVRHVRADVTEVRLDESGDIASLDTEQGISIAGDLFVDCTGFAALLIGGAMKVPFRSCTDVLFCDTALAMQVPYDRPDAPIASHTISTAQSSGWIWDIGLPTRRGVGHVYASGYTSDDQAEAELRAYILQTGGPAEIPTPRKLSFNPGYREKFWHRNCVAIGLSAGFIEPLEASALALVEMSAAMVSDDLPATREAMDIVAKRFNDAFLYRWERVIDFLKLHYVLSQRRDTAYWRDNTAAVPERLAELLTLWRHRAPSRSDFYRLEEVFPPASYQYILYGMGFRSDFSRAARPQEAATADAYFQEAAGMAHKMLSGLPDNRTLINHIKRHGLQKI